MIFTFYCDESHDSTNVKRTPGAAPFVPVSYVVAGFFSDPESWRKIERQWKSKNELEGVTRFHASHLNAGTWEYQGWSKSRRTRYSKEILKILKDRRGRLHGVSCGLYADEYYKIISPEGQMKMGHPYIFCFNSVVATVAKQMDTGNFPKSDQFSVVVDRGEFAQIAIESFYWMKGNPECPFRHRLAECSADSAEKAIGLQPADFVAYEVFKRMHRKRRGQMEMRRVLHDMLGTTSFFCHQFDGVALSRMKDEVDRTPSAAGKLVVIPSQTW